MPVSTASGAGDQEELPTGRSHGYKPLPSDEEHAKIRIPHEHHGEPESISRCPECSAWAIERFVEQAGGPCVHFALFADGPSASAAADELADCRTRVQHSAFQKWPWALLVATNSDAGIRAVVARHGGTYAGWEAMVDAATGEAVIDPDGP